MHVNPLDEGRSFYIKHTTEDHDAGTYREHRIYIEKSIANYFGVPQNSVVEVSIVDRRDVIISSFYDSLRIKNLCIVYCEIFYRLRWTALNCRSRSVI